MTEDFSQVLNSSRLSIIGNFNNRREPCRLDQGEHSVMGYFSSNLKAKQALAQIRDLGYEIAQLDLVNNPSADRFRPLWSVRCPDLSNAGWKAPSLI